MAQPRLAGKVAIVTGAGSRGEGVGNGRAAAVLFAREGARVLLVDQDRAAAEATHEMIKAEGGEAACQNILAAQPDVDLFFNEADDMVIGCARAVRAAGSRARLIGVGGSKLAIASIKAGAVDGTVCFKPEALGALAFRALAGEKGPRFRTYPIPAVTRVNVVECVGQW